MLIVSVFLCSVERRFSVPATLSRAVVRSLGQGWPKAIAVGKARAYDLYRLLS